MIESDFYGPFLTEIETGRRIIDQMRLGCQNGAPPSPQEVAGAARKARQNFTALAGFLGINQKPRPPMDEAGVDVFNQAVDLCMDFARLALELSRSQGPAYLQLIAEN